MIFAIESSCDESALALFDPKQGLLGEWVHSQIDLHQDYGGVVPDLASREHLLRFGPMIQSIQRKLPIDQISHIAVTQGPGLAGCLAMGIALAKALALAWQKPLVGVNHLRGHAFSPFIALHQTAPATFASTWESALPHLGLIVSGGNTVLFSLDSNRRIEIIAQTVDDAAGEALDKGAKLMGMPYPGGPLIEAKAQSGNPTAFAFPRAMSAKNDLRFSFSGLKTALRYQLEALDDEALLSCQEDLCASYQEAVIDQLIQKTRHALRKLPFRSLGLSGGVANNQRLRGAFQQLADTHNIPCYTAAGKHSGDNAAMIAFAAFVDPDHTVTSERYNLGFAPSLPLAQQC